MVAALAGVVGQGATPRDAGAQLVDEKELARKPVLGTRSDQMMESRPRIRPAQLARPSHVSIPGSNTPLERFAD